MVTLLVHDRLLWLTSDVDRLEVINAGTFFRNASEHRGYVIRWTRTFLWLNRLGDEGTSRIVRCLKLDSAVVYSLALAGGAERGRGGVVLMYIDRVVVAARSRMDVHVQLMLTMVVVVAGCFLIEPVGELGHDYFWVVVFLFLFVLKSALAPINVMLIKIMNLKK